MYFVALLLIILASSGNAAIIYPNGKCVPLEECPQLQNLAKTRRNDFGARNLLRLLYCHDTGEGDRFRCISSEDVTDYISKSDLLPVNNCGLNPVQPKLANGEIADLTEYPWVALLKYRNNAGNISYGCHGNLINKKYVLTAAHCVHPEITRTAMQIGEVYSVVLGEYYTQNKTDCIDEECIEAKEFLIDYYRIHENFDVKSKVNDIALIRLKGEVEFSANTPNIKPICLPINSLELNQTEVWFVAGWGTTENYKMNQIKMKAKFVNKKKENCTFANLNLTDNHICAQSLHKAKTCAGDSGGPLMMIRRINSSPRTILIGVNSLGILDCNNDIQVTVFAKVSAYVDWIVYNLEK